MLIDLKNVGNINKQHKDFLSLGEKDFFKHVKISVADPDPGGKKASKMYRFIDEF